MIPRIAIVCLLPMVLAATARAATYTITDLGTLGGSESAAYAINNRGQIAGMAFTTGNSTADPVRFFGNTVTDLGNFGGVMSQANGINTAGVIVGNSYLTGNASIHAFAAFGATLVDLGTLGGSNSYALAVNDSGQIAGHAQTSGNTATHAFRYQNAKMVDLGTLAGTTGSSYGYGINSAGHVAGQSVAGSARAFLYNGTAMNSLGTLGTGNASVAYAINDNDQIVGASNIVNGGVDHPFLYQNGQMNDLGTLGGSAGTAYAINLSSQIVGEAQTSNNAAYHAFLSQGGQMTDLNTLLPANSGWELTSARAINDSSQIVGIGTIGGHSHGFLLSPISTSTSASNERPRIYINGARRVVTDRSTIKVEGSVGGPVTGVKYYLGKDGAHPANGGTNGWRFKARLSVGRNVIRVVAFAANGATSYPARLVVFRTHG